MAQRPVEKHYGERTLQERADGYFQISIPPQAVDDPKTDIEAGGTVSIRGMITGEEAYIRIQRVSEDE